jgi:magnesium transporter
MQRQKISVLVDPLRRLLRRGAKAHATNLLSKLHVADVARLLQVLNLEDSQQAFALVLRDDPQRAAEVLAELDPSDALKYLGGRSDRQIADILTELGADDAAELVEAFPEEMKERVLAQLEQAGQPAIEHLLQYEEETAGRIMAPEVFALRRDLTVSEAIEAIRSSSAEDLEMVFYLYVVDEEGHLVGVCSLRDLLLARGSQPIGDVMNAQLVSVGVDTDQEEVAHLVARYNYLALPVVDHDNKLVGLITVDDIIDIIREEESEDMLLMAGVGEDEEEVLTAPLWRNVLLRLPWLFAAWVGGILASQVMSHYSAMIGQVVALSFFIPIIVGMGGNVGTQAATIVVRGLATGRLIAGQTWITVLRELRVALSLGIFFGLLLGVAVYLLNRDPNLGIAVALALITAMGLAATVGASTPLLLKRFGVDPAIATGPFVTTSIDVLGIMVYFTIASVLVL